LPGLGDGENIGRAKRVKTIRLTPRRYIDFPTQAIGKNPRTKPVVKVKEVSLLNRPGQRERENLHEFFSVVIKRKEISTDSKASAVV
jgi:hypothetical protein